MPRAKRVETPAPVTAQNQLWFMQTGNAVEYRVADWDPDTATFTQAILEVLSQGVTVVLRPGSGGRSIGIAFWIGDNRQPPVWFYEHEELDAWAKKLVDGFQEEYNKKHGLNGA